MQCMECYDALDSNAANTQHSIEKLFQTKEVSSTNKMQWEIIEDL